MMDLMTEKLRQLSDSMAAKEETIIVSAISTFLGHADWSLAEMANRCHWKQYIEKPKERTLYCDDTPILWLHEPESISVDDPYTIKYGQKYRMLVDNSETIAEK